jgi:hypothetical protein
MIGGGSIANAKALTGWPKQFDLDCQLHGRVVSDPHPISRGTSPANVKSWALPARFAIDLSSKRFCDVVECKKLGTISIFSVDRNKVVLEKKRGLEMTLRRRDSFLRIRNVDGGRIDVTEGHCRVKKFSGFPAAQSPVQ